MTVSILTTQNSGMDRYSQEIARRATGPVVAVDRYNSDPVRMWETVDALKELCQPVHYPNQHFGWYAFATGLPYVMTVHDLERMCISYPDEEPDEQATLRQDAAAIQQAHHIIAVSNATKRDIVRYLRVPEKRVTVVHNGVDHSVFCPQEPVHEEFPFILYVGSERPRKNLRRVLAAFAQVKRSPGFEELKLVKVGSPGRSPGFRDDTAAAIDEFGLEDEVVFVDEVDDGALASYYASAKALVYASLYEGFGFPLAEAMATGCPVITSQRGAQAEVAGNAGVLVDPLETGELARAIIKVVVDPNLRRKMTANGLKQSSKYSWDKAADATFDIFRSVEAKVKKANNLDRLCDDDSPPMRSYDARVLVEAALLANPGGD